MKFVYLAPSDIQVPRVDRQCIVSFCDALHQLSVDVELVAMKIKLLDVEAEAPDALAPYRIREPFPVQLVRVPAHQESRGWWLALLRLVVHLRAARRAVRTANGSDPLVFYEKNYAPALALLALRALTRKRPLVAFEAHLPPRNLVQRLVLRHADAVIANTEALARDLVDSGDVSSGDVIGVHQGVDLELIDASRLPRDEARKRLGLPVEKKLVIYTGKIYWGYKEVDYILEAARLLKAEQDLRFIMVGGRADHVARLKREIAAQGVQNVEFVGFIPPRDVHAYQQAADVLVLYYPSGLELNRYRSPGKLFDYLAAARPIVAADLPVIREVLGDNAPVLLVPQDSPELLAEAIRSVVSDRSAAGSRGFIARERVARFTWEARARRITGFVDQIHRTGLRGDESARPA